MSVFIGVGREAVQLDLPEVPTAVELAQPGEPLSVGYEPVTPPEQFVFPEPPPDGTPFPWHQLSTVGSHFDRMPDGLKDAVSWFFIPGDWEPAAAISECESGWRLSATRDTRGQQLPPGVTVEYSVGPWQINLLAHPDVAEANARDYWYATQWAAQHRYARGNWWDWCCCANQTGADQCPNC